MTPQQLAQSQQLRAQMEERLRSDEGLLRMRAARARLPAWNCCQELVDAVRRNQVTIVAGETGCGKTTQLPQFIYDDAVLRGEGAACKIVCTQPRRISATSVATRVASERSEKIGGTVRWATEQPPRLSLPSLYHPILCPCRSRCLPPVVFSLCFVGRLDTLSAWRRLPAPTPASSSAPLACSSAASSPTRCSTAPATSSSTRRATAPPHTAGGTVHQLHVVSNTFSSLAPNNSRDVVYSLTSRDTTRTGARAVPRFRLPPRPPPRLPPASALAARRAHERDPRRQGLLPVLWRGAGARLDALI